MTHNLKNYKEIVLNILSTLISILLIINTYYDEKYKVIKDISNIGSIILLTLQSVNSYNLKNKNKILRNNSLSNLSSREPASETHSNVVIQEI